MAVKNWTDIERDVIAEWLQDTYQGRDWTERNDWTRDAEMLQKAIGATLLTRGADVSSKPVPVFRIELVPPEPVKRVRFL